MLLHCFRICLFVCIDFTVNLYVCITCIANIRKSQNWFLNSSKNFWIIKKIDYTPQTGQRNILQTNSLHSFSVLCFHLSRPNFSTSRVVGYFRALRAFVFSATCQTVYYNVSYFIFQVQKNTHNKTQKNVIQVQRHLLPHVRQHTKTVMGSSELRVCRA